MGNLSKEEMIRNRKVIHEFLVFMNKESKDYILKGGTSLMECYNMQRMSQDIDLDSINKNQISKIVSDFCKKNNYSFRIAKDTDTVKRFMINYGDNSHPLKIEISYRRKNIDKEDYQIINGINVYNIDVIATMKANAYSSRDKIRDLYDVVFICNNYWNSLNKYTQNNLRTSIEYKGIEQFDYLTSTQTDDQIDIDELASDFLEASEKIGLIMEDNYNESLKIPDDNLSDDHEIEL